MSINTVTLIGRITKDPNISYTSNQMCIAKFNIALDRGKDKNGESKGTDFPQIVAFGKVAELIERYTQKGSQVGISGHIHTDSYEKDGKKVYTTDVIADRVELMGKAESKEKPKQDKDVPDGFFDDPSIPF